MPTQEARSGYTNRNNPPEQFYHDGGRSATSKEAGTFTRRIGPTVYRVNARYSLTSGETISDKITRLVRNEISGKAVNQ